MNVGAEHEEETEPKQMSFLAAAGWTISLVLAGSAIASLTESARPGASLDLVSRTASEVLAYSVLVFAMVRVYAPTTPMRVALGVRPVSPVHVLLAAIAGAGLAPVAAALDALMAARFPTAPEEIEAQTKLLTAATTGSRIALVVAFVLVLPMAHELFFRGIMFGGLRKGRTLGVAVLATTVYYAGGRTDVRGFVLTFLLGLLFAWLRGQSGSVASSLAAHVAFQAVDIVPLARTGDPAAEFTYPRSWTLAGALAAVVALVAARALAARADRALEHEEE